MPVMENRTMRSFPTASIRRLAPFALALQCLWQAVPARAQARPDSPVSIHGYLTQGFARAWGNPIAGAPDGASTLDYRSVALQVGYSFTALDKLVVQLSHRRLGTSILEGDANTINLDWGFYERRVLGEGSIRLGKLPLPRGLFNEIRHVGTALPFYRAPLTIYFESAETIDGAAVGYRFFAHEPWSMQAEVFGGGYQFDYVRHEPQESFVESIHARSVHGAQLWLDAPMPGTRVGLGGQRYRHDGADDPTWYSTWQLSGEFLWNRVTGRAEYVQADSRGYSYEAVQAQVGYRLLERLTFNVQGEYGDVFVTFPGAELTVDYARDLAGGLVWSVWANTALKFELHGFEGHALDRYTGFQGPPGRSTYFIASLAVGF
jgi:hypothetical protein